MRAGSQKGHREQAQHTLRGANGADSGKRLRAERAEREDMPGFFSAMRRLENARMAKERARPRATGNIEVGGGEVGRAARADAPRHSE